MTYREFFLKDHLGNIRVRYVDKNGNGLIEVDTTDQKVNELTGSYHYYPFGMEWDGGKYRKHPTNPPPTEGNFFYNQDVQNKYRYNGKEFIEDYGISLYEYGARWYDPAVGRFICVDPIADKFPELSVYNYASNDPVKNIDLHGLQGHRADMHLHNEMREQKGNQEYEDAKKSIQQVEKKALISIGAIAILLIPTPEDILLGLAINGLSKAGKIVKAGRAVEKVVAKTDEVVDAAKTSTTALRKVGSVLESVDDVMANPNLLKGKSPLQVEGILGKTPGWRIETLGQGSQKGNGWVLRQYNAKGNPTGPQLRWHPGGGHHGPTPYWRVVGPNGDLGGIIR